MLTLLSTFGRRNKGTLSPLATLYFEHWKAQSKSIAKRVNSFAWSTAICHTDAGGRRQQQLSRSWWRHYEAGKRCPDSKLSIHRHSGIQFTGPPIRAPKFKKQKYRAEKYDWDHCSGFCEAQCQEQTTVLWHSRPLTPAWVWDPRQAY